MAKGVILLLMSSFVCIRLRSLNTTTNTQSPPLVWNRFKTFVASLSSITTLMVGVVVIFVVVYVCVLGCVCVQEREIEESEYLS